MFSFLLGRHIGVELPGHGVAYIYFCMKLPDLYPKTISITLKKVLQLINSGYQGKKLRMTVDLLIIHICIVKIQTMVLLLKRTKVWATLWKEQSQESTFHLRQVQVS